MTILPEKRLYSCKIQCLWSKVVTTSAQSCFTLPNYKQHCIRAKMVVFGQTVVVSWANTTTLPVYRTTLVVYGQRGCPIRATSCPVFGQRCFIWDNQVVVFGEYIVLYSDEVDTTFGQSTTTCSRIRARWL